jgi:hypothetical protein
MKGRVAGARNRRYLQIAFASIRVQPDDSQLAHPQYARSPIETAA